MQRFLIIQTAFLGDVVLALPVAQQLHAKFPDAEIHFLVRKGNESLLANHPAIHRVWVWDKAQGKLRTLWELAKALRRIPFDRVVNLHRFESTVLLTLTLRAREKVGFARNPVVRLVYDSTLLHRVGRKGDPDFPHEVQRNLSLIADITGGAFEPPRLYPSEGDIAAVADLVARRPYVILAPASVWFTKQWPAERWAELAKRLPADLHVYLIGAPGDAALCEQVAAARPGSEVLAGRLTLLQSAALMAGADRVYCNDSAPLHLASAMDAPTTAFFCSTAPEFGFGPLAPGSEVLQAPEPLPCRPCGLHGKRACPEGHFKCGWNIPAPGAD